MKLDTAKLEKQEGAVHFFVSGFVLPTSRRDVWLGALTSVQVALVNVGLGNVMFCPYGLELKVGLIPYDLSFVTDVRRMVMTVSVAVNTRRDFVTLASFLNAAGVDADTRDSLVREVETAADRMRA